MARSRIQQASQSVNDEETDVDDEQETPRQQRVKKRVSEAYIPDNEVPSESGRPPLRTKSVNINDDAAEKRKRRKSNKLNVIENALAGPSSEGMLVSEKDHGETVRAGKQKQLNTVTPPQISDTPFDVMNSNFEEWMKMATDNKINAANSWNFALIDYFHDMSLLRNVDDNSINFQRASCTLDGCVKIWTSRVDSVGTETGKLLNNINTGGMDNDDEVDSDNPEVDPTQVKKKQKQHRPGATLAKDPAQLRSKKLDLEFSVDPLFKKTCADFDEGGAQGLLMNHLSLGMGREGAMRVIFDASDSIGGKADDEEDEDLIEPEDGVDLSYLRKEFLPDLSVLEDKAISHSLSGFSFSRDAFSFDDTTALFKDNSGSGDIDDDDDDDFGGGDGFEPGNEGGLPPVEDFFVGADAAADDYGADMFGGGGAGDENAPSPASGEDDQRGEERPAQFVPFDPRRMPTERDLIMAMTDADGDGGTMDYFDQNFLKNWAGPEHWKVRKVIRKPDAETNATNKATKPRQKKEAFKIDFLTPLEEGKDLKELTKELFAPVTKGASINLPGTATAKKGKRKATKEKEKKDDHRLPDDMHFSSRQLVTLFLKPKFYLKMRGHKVRFNEAGDGEVDENFWVQAAAEQAAGRNGAEDEEDQTDGAIPFNTQFFHDDYDDGPGFDDVDPYDGDGPGIPEAEAGEQDLLAATAGQTRRVRPELVNYAKRAKRVDVRKLKENIWKGLDITITPPQRDREDDMDVDDEPSADQTEEGRVFGQVIDGLQKSYPRDKMAEISTSFCFICLLHLANEQGLKLEAGTGVEPSNDGEGEVIGRSVGDIWSLKIYRDPTASPAA
ncbi:hypothetical protein M378DRAFT_10689 [Amanita muscaria Koide BX008]|uniref:Condensin complex subunit 2 n=1 Tax=Amanita muscaria (strain Koide BX008) TaxID=946122 RepID=A0A0C2TFD5_AMAMK|nr:hypothetical protein M378DRAFT_10689 [Amanita muscaria Koide BX008]